MKLVSVIIPNWNGGVYIRRCLDCVLSQTYEAVETIVVDNGSVDGSADIVARDYPQVTLIRSPHNRGFAWAQNRGIEQSRGDYILPLNTDVFLTRDFVERAVRGAESGSDIGSVACRTLRDGTGELLNVGVYLRKRISLVNSNNMEKKEFVFGAGGSSPLYKREMVEDVKIVGSPFDEAYFAYWEDTDLAWRAQLYGWKCLYVPDAVAYHVGSASLDEKVRFVEKPPVFQRYIVKNRYMTITKNLSPGLFLRLLPFLLLAEILSWTYLTFRIPKRLPCLLGGVWDYLRELPLTMKKRRIVQGNRTVSDSYMYQWFKGF